MHALICLKLLLMTDGYQRFTAYSVWQCCLYVKYASYRILLLNYLFMVGLALGARKCHLYTQRSERMDNRNLNIGGYN